MTDMHGTIDAADPRIQPCRHMVNLVSALSDGTLRGLQRWYTEKHIAGCPRCRKALEALRTLRDRLSSLCSQAPPSFSPERRSKLSNALDDADRRG